ncbi:MAG: UDP-N-acetylglucosamine 4,6-dehydratase (inverting), partial [Kiloniellales bacterium]|nr:UDP-N-acetylglucosamine 4,6-dehydratase (inverting) [Kiloniellales bacterium]
MITRDDARHTYDFGDRYVIEPSAHMWDQDRVGLAESGGKLVPEGFEYTSDNNQDWLDASGLQQLLEEGAS